jgi:hypothetical protein
MNSGSSKLIRYKGNFRKKSRKIFKKQKGQKKSRKTFKKQNFSAKSRRGGNPDYISLLCTSSYFLIIVLLYRIEQANL